MGVWGTGIYSNDTAMDLRDTCQEIYPFCDAEKGLNIIETEYADFFKEDCCIDGDYADFWYAFADWHWKHGILSEKHRIKVLKLLENKVGLSEWEEAGNSKDIKKRLDVMIKLEEKLKGEMPQTKLPRVRLQKPLHKPGDIVVIKTCSEADDPTPLNVKKAQDGCDHWSFSRAYLRNIFKDKRLQFRLERAERHSPSLLFYPIYTVSSPKPITIYDESFRFEHKIDIHNKYIALLCVGQTSSLYSQYFPDLYNTCSTYAIYDYISDELPNISDLMNCGFMYYDINLNGECYISEILAFEFGKYLLGNIEYVKNCFNETERFFSLIQRKGYKSIAYQQSLAGQVKRCLSFKLLFENMGIEYDNLLDENITPLDIISDEEYKSRIKKKQTITRAAFEEYIQKRQS